MNARLTVIIVMFSLLWAGNSPAVQPDERLSDPTLEERARELSKDIRCLVCQNQSIDDSSAELARDLRILVRERLTAGDSNQQIFDFLVARYGLCVVVRPISGFCTCARGIVRFFLPPHAGECGATRCGCVDIKRTRAPFRLAG